MAAHGEVDTSDATVLSNTLVMSSAGGTVTVYATADETFTTVDTSTGTAVSIPGEAVANYMFTYSISGGQPQLTGIVDADAALQLRSGDDPPTAYSAVLDGPAMQAENQGAPLALATNSAGDFAIGTDSAAAPCINRPAGGNNGSGYDCPNRTNEVNFALRHAFPGTTKNENGFADDCTDFASRSLHFGGSLPEDVPVSPSLQRHDDSYWYQFYSVRPPQRVTSRSWANSLHLGDFFNGQGSYFLRYVSSSKPGYIIFASWAGNGWAGIGHAGVITMVNGHNVYITQHTNNRKNEALYREAGRISWYRSHPHLQVWIVIPSRKS